MSNSIHYDIDYRSESFEEQVLEEGPNPLLDLRIVIGDEEIKGAAENESHLDDYMGMHIVKLLDSIPKIQNGNTVEFRFYSHPQTLLLDPNGEQLSLACVSPSKVGGLTDEDMYEVPREAFVQEVLRVAEEFVEKVVNVDKELSNNDTIRDVKQRVAKIRENS